MGDERSPFKERIKHVHFGTPRKPRAKVDRAADVKHTELVGDRGQYGGYNTEHADGMTDCTVKAEPIKGGLRVNPE